MHHSHSFFGFLEEMSGMQASSSSPSPAKSTPKVAAGSETVEDDDDFSRREFNAVLLALIAATLVMCVSLCNPREVVSNGKAAVLMLVYFWWFAGKLLASLACVAFVLYALSRLRFRSGSCSISDFLLYVQRLL